MNLQDFACACSDLIWGGDCGWCYPNEERGLKILFSIIQEKIKPNIGYYRQDDDSHNYIIPENQIKYFDEILDRLVSGTVHGDEYYDLESDFCNKFDRYRVDGVNDIKIIMEDN